MQTQCPHCQTKFRLTETQVSIADGFVRCGVCNEVFNAFEITDQNDQQNVLLDDERFNHQATEALSQLPGKEALPSEQENNHLKFEQQPFKEPAIESQSIIESTDFNATTATDESRKEAFDFFNEDDNDSLQHVVPDELRDSHASQSPLLLSNILWSSAILLLIASLFIEYAWFNRHQLSQIPELQDWIEKLCQQVDCNNISVRDPSKIELVTRNVYSHPNENNALMVNLTMKNNADFAQPYPVLQINFSDIRGNSVAARRFLPAEYIASEAQQLDLLQPDTSFNISLEIQDPGNQAKTYEFNFL